MERAFNVLVVVMILAYALSVAVGALIRWLEKKIEQDPSR